MTKLLKSIFSKSRIPFLVVFAFLVIIFIFLYCVLFPENKDVGVVSEVNIPKYESTESSDIPKETEILPEVIPPTTDELYAEYTASFAPKRLQEPNVVPKLSGHTAAVVPSSEDGKVFLHRDEDDIPVYYIGSSAGISSKITSLELPDSVTAILSQEANFPESTGAFYENVSLETFIGSKELIYIGNNAFYRCLALKDVFLPMTLRYIGDRAFGGCKSIESISIFGSCSVGKAAFAGCAKLEKVYLSDTVQRIGLGAFEHTPFYDDLTDEFCVVGDVLLKYNGKGENVVIPDGVRIIADGTFAGRLTIESVTVPDSVEYIGNSAFRSCAKLGEVVFVDGSLPVMGENAFDGCPVEASDIIGNLTVDAREMFYSEMNVEEIGFMD